MSPTGGLALLGEILHAIEIPIKNCLRLHDNKASPRRDLAIVHLRSHLVGQEISHVNATEGAGPPSRVDC